MRFVAIDFETANRGADSACAVGVVLADEGRIVHRETHLICPPPGEFVFSYIHGLERDDVCDAPDFSRVWSRLAPLLEGVDFLAAHNAPFDRSWLCSMAFLALSDSVSGSTGFWRSGHLL